MMHTIVSAMPVDDKPVVLVSDKPVEVNLFLMKGKILQHVL
jgi:hypothetical protein